VTVFQDGTASDIQASAGFRFDDAFRSGAPEPGEIDRVWVWASKISMDPDTGMSAVFKMIGPRTWWQNAWPYINIQPNDYVEFFCDAPDNDTSVATPDWHLNNQSGQVRIFRGWVEGLSSQGARHCGRLTTSRFSATQHRASRSGRSHST
jgi:hypothetical protein